MSQITRHVLSIETLRGEMLKEDTSLFPEEDPYHLCPEEINDMVNLSLSKLPDILLETAAPELYDVFYETIERTLDTLRYR